MKYPLYFSERTECRRCTETSSHKFEYIETKPGEKYVFEATDFYTLVFMLEGEALVTCDEYCNEKLKSGDMTLWAVGSKCSWESITPTAAIVMSGNEDLTPCDKRALKEHADCWLSADPGFKTLPIRPRLMEYLTTVKHYLQDGITCPQMHIAKQRELPVLLRAYYTKEETIRFFLPTVRQRHEFESFIMSNYLKMKGVKEFVDLSGMNLSTFNRKFKVHFNESPYQWLMKQRSKHIYHALSTTDKSFSSIAREFHFSDSSHFNRYCKAMFGDTPTAIRQHGRAPSHAAKEHSVIITK